MEILISLIISLIVGIGLMEMYAWLGPLAMWIVRRAARELPDGRAEEFMEQWDADLATVPNSIMKVCFVIRDCLLPIKDIAQIMFRDDFEHMTEKSDQVFVRISGAVNELLYQSEVLVQETDISAAKFISMVNFSLERLQQVHNNNDPHAWSAIERIRSLNPPLTAKFAQYQSAIERSHTIVLELATNVREPLAKIAEASLRVRDRLRDDSPIVEKDMELLESLYAPFADVNTALDSFEFEIPNDDDLDPIVKTTAEAIRTAIRAVKQARMSH